MPAWLIELVKALGVPVVEALLRRGAESDPVIEARVRDILPERSASAIELDRIRAEEARAWEDVP